MRTVLKILLIALFFVPTLLPVFIATAQEFSPFDPNRERNQGEGNEATDEVEGYGLEAARGNAKRMTTRAEVQLRRILAKAVEMGNLSQQEADALEAEYMAMLSGLNADVDSAETLEKLRTVLADLRSSAGFAAAVDRLVPARRAHGANAVSVMIARMEYLAGKIERHIEGAKGVGHDTSEVESNLESALSKIASAKSLLAEQESDNTDMLYLKESYTQLKELLRGAHTDLVNAAKILRVLYDENPWEPGGYNAR